MKYLLTKTMAFKTSQLKLLKTTYLPLTTGGREIGTRKRGHVCEYPAVSSRDARSLLANQFFVAFT